MLFTLDSHCSQAGASRSCTEDDWPPTDFFYLISICVSESDCKGGEGEGDGCGDEGGGVSDSGGVGYIEAWTTTGDAE